MDINNLITGYRFDDFAPRVGQSVHCFRTRQALHDFAKSQGQEFFSVRFWEIQGTLIRDEGGDDGLVMRVTSIKQLFLNLQY
jgi:hypothetical protein